MKAIIGALVKDVPYYIFLLLQGNKHYLKLCNRNEQLKYEPKGEGYQCNWQWTSDLYLPKVFPVFGKWLLNRAFEDYPIFFADKPASVEIKPEVSFLIGHRGQERLPLLQMTLKTIAAQTGCHIECIVVEQDNEKLIQDELPDWVRYIHTPLPDKDMPYSRSWAFNVAAKEAKSDCLIFHDNDMLVPAIYAKDILNYHQQGYDFINLKRFIFYLNKGSSKKHAEIGDFSGKSEVEAIVQNLEAGGSFGASRQAFFEIGGFDEAFIGWGGEDNEFWERANTRKIYPYGYQPIMHLWHKPQPDKIVDEENSAKALFWNLNKFPVEERIKRLTSGK